MTTSIIHTNFPSVPGNVMPQLRTRGFKDGKFVGDNLTSPEAAVLILAHQAAAAISLVPSVAAPLLLVL